MQQIQTEKWYVSVWPYPELPEGRLEGPFNTKKQAQIESGAIGKWHRDSIGYYTSESGRVHVCKGSEIVE